MSITSISRKWPSYAGAVRESLVEIFDGQSSDLTKHQLYGIALSIGYSLKNSQLLDLIRAEAKMYLEDCDADACKIAAVMMALHNTFHNFSDKIENQEIAALSSKFDMEMATSTEVEPQNIASYCLAISILNGSKYCMDYYIDKLLLAGASKEVVRDIARVVSVLKATVEVLEIERRRSYEFIVRECFSG